MAYNLRDYLAYACLPHGSAWTSCPNSPRKTGAALRKELGSAARLIVVDEADRLKMPSLEQIRDLFDRTQVGWVLVGMPGLEKRLARYAQFYSRIGFVHKFRPLSTTQVRQLLEQHWTPSGVTLPATEPLEDETIATIVRVTGGNFRLLRRLNLRRCAEVEGPQWHPRRSRRRAAAATRLLRATGGALALFRLSAPRLSDLERGGRRRMQAPDYGSV